MSVNTAHLMNTIRYEDDYNPDLHPGYYEDGVPTTNREDEVRASANASKWNSFWDGFADYSNAMDVMTSHRDNMEDPWDTTRRIISGEIFNGEPTDNFEGVPYKGILGASTVGSAIGTGLNASGVLAPNQGFNDAYDLINKTAQANNDWSANQALRQMQFQEYMSNTAHQREVADLKAAGLNPVLSAGGSGASTPSGAMGQTDMSNTSAIADVAMMALDAMQNTASAFGKQKTSIWDNYYVKRGLGSAISTAARYAVRAALKV